MDYRERICVLYDGEDNKYAAEAHQVKIIFHPESKNLEKYIEQKQDKHIYIELKPECYTLENMKRLQELKKFDNWTLQISVSMILDKQKKVDNNKFNAIKDCCNRYMFTDLIGNWEVLQFIIALKPSEVYITNMLGFCIPDLMVVLNDTEIKIRLICNLAQSAWEDSNDLTKFFIRPEDMEAYNVPIISGFEFAGDNPIQEVCYKVYNRGYWYGDLKELIIGFKDSVDSRCLPPNFGRYRMNCRKRCISGRNCYLCKSMKYFSEKMKQTNTQIIPPAKLKNKSDD
jgi:hypothetical protein